MQEIIANRVVSGYYAVTIGLKLVPNSLHSMSSAVRHAYPSACLSRALFAYDLEKHI
jgi:hypothetical protein